MSQNEFFQGVVAQAGEREKNYHWLEAIDLYDQALRVVEKGEIREKVGYAFYRAAMQAESVDEFRERMRLAVANYEKAKELYITGESGKKPRMLRCAAMIAYLGYWLASEVSEKKRLLDECWRLTKDALKAFEEAGEALEYGKTYNQLSKSAVLGFSLQEDFHVREKAIREGVEHGERAITFLSTLRDLRELARAYVKTAHYLEGLGWYFLDIDEQKRCYQKVASYWLKASELSEETAMIESPAVGGPSYGWGEGTEKALMNFKKALEYSRKTRDHFTVGCALELLAYHTAWKANATEDPDERIELYKIALQYAEDSKHSYSLISFVSPPLGVYWVEAPHPEYYLYLARFVEINPNKKRELLEKAVEATPDLLKRAEKSGYPDAMRHANHILGAILWLLAMTETNFDEKKKLLEKAMKHRNESIRLTEQLEPMGYWNRGVMLGSLARVKSELANLAKDSETKKNMLQEAILDYETAEKLCIKGLESYEMEASISLYAVLGQGQYEYGDLLNWLYGLTNNREHLRKAAETFENAAQSFQKANLISRMAECYWKTAHVYDNLGEHLKAAESFDLASNNYENAAEKIPQLKDFYRDHALYMQAWSEIEKARHHHARQEYGIAREHYEKAATMHKSLKQWSYLAPNYSAWAQVENAEDLSRREQSEEALQAFEEAAKLFNETKKSLETKLREIENLDEKTMATNLIKASDLRREYCIGRIALEEAKIHDKKGDHYSSSQKYDSAAETFGKIAQELESEQDRKEFNLIVSLSRAWQKMMMAEARASSILYGEAAELFKQAKEHTLNQPTSLLALANCSFCKALEAGTEFETTRDMTTYSTAKKHMEAAANYYLKAGFKNASEYARATELLFDAYMHMHNAKKETDPEKKAKFYIMTEKVLQASAGSFMKAEHPEKREQVLRLLEKVKEERELALSLSEVMHAPAIVSTTTAFSTPTPTQENAVGLERFEHADIQANIITRQKTLKVGENLDLEIELVNAGKGTALLIKLAEVIPEGFELTEKPEIYRVEDNFLNMKGKRLDPLKTEEIRLVLKPKVQGTFPLKPKVLYLDENGKYKSHEPEPVLVSVKELGIKGWIKGER